MKVYELMNQLAEFDPECEVQTIGMKYTWEWDAEMEESVEVGTTIWESCSQEHITQIEDGTVRIGVML